MEFYISRIRNSGEIYNLRWERYLQSGAALHIRDCLQSLYIDIRRKQMIRGNKMSEKRNVTYMLRCSDGTLYTGWTNNIEKRLEAHNAGKGGKYTRVRIPVELVYLEEHETKQEAMSREAQIKQLTRREKEALMKKEEVI
jgi:putative endonuclease